MKGLWLFVLGAVCGAAAIAAPRIMAHLHAVLHARSNAASSGTQRVHTEEKFSFTAKAPMDRVAPLFGADKERVWAPNWNPTFLHPSSPTDELGMVFTVAHDHRKAAWVNTQFDLQSGHIQYVYTVPDALITVITLQLTPQGNQTRVDVEYDRTALSAEVDLHVQHMAEADRTSGPEWEKQVNGYLEGSRNQ